MTEEAKTKSGEPTACFPGDLSKISKPVILRKEQAMPTERVSTNGTIELERGVVHQLPDGIRQQRRPGAGLVP